MYHVHHLTNKELKEAIRTKYAWPGGYEIFGITSDGACLCCDCMRANYRSIATERKHTSRSNQWQVDALDTTATCDGEAVHCDHCSKAIYEPEYNEDEGER